MCTSICLPFRWGYAIQKANVPISASQVGTEELGHLEMVGTLVYQLTRDLSEEQIKSSGFDTYFVDHTAGIYPAAASGTAWTADYMASKGDVITDLTEDMAAEGATNKRLLFQKFQWMVTGCSFVAASFFQTSM